MRSFAVGPSTTVLCGVMLIGTAACGAILGLDDFENEGAGGSGAAGAATGSPAASGSGASGAAGGASSAGGGGGSGGVPPGCGNGQLDADETCDGDCPTECIDVDLCTSQKLQGSADDCDAVCPFSPVLACKDDDGCCPDGCFQGNDDDCMPKVLVVAWDSNLNSVDASLTATGRFGVVDTFSAAMTVPTLALLEPYAAVLVYANAAWHDGDADLLGDVLADYYDGGGRVVLANGANCADEFRVAGRFAAEGYHLLDEGGVVVQSADSVAVETESPLLVDAQTFTTGFHCVGEPLPGVTVVAEYPDVASIVRGQVKGRTRVDVNVYPAVDHTNLAVTMALANALLYPSDP